ncbi:hypothetical protein DAH66_12835 [Sphingomonas koreensis]|uniref:Uncharacterized protein n=1 Tax=Sphingomonas koreensis TaxID=93064 RepID=A0A430G2F1_9SPHN|nr:hypothetical protein [Sphingomonas koreensis]RSY83148.1 hypothetical protein DAH66_12835 [Sphingomonas koreensis]
MTRWYRAYEGTVTDPKLGEAAMIAGTSRSVAVTSWHAIMESACETRDAGRFVTTPRRLAVILAEPLDIAQAIIAAFAEIGLTTGDRIAAWSRRQYESDSSTERSRKHRENKRNGDATLPRRRATPPETEADTESSDATASGAGAPPAPPPPPQPADLRAAVFASGVPLLIAAGQSDPRARSMLGRWRKGFTDGAVLDALAAAQVENPSDPIAWITAALERRNAPKRQTPADRGIRGSRPDPSVDLYRAAIAAEAEEARAAGRGARGG